VIAIDKNLEHQKSIISWVFCVCKRVVAR
jgi:hypothetical protein